MGLKQLRKSIRKRGQLQPIVVDKRTGVVIDGTKRKLAVPDMDLWKREIETKDNAEAIELMLESMSPMLKGKERRLWVQRKYDALTRLGLSRARAVELLSKYSGYSKRQIWNLLKFFTKGGSSEVVSERKPIKIEKEIAFDFVEPNCADLILTDPPYAYNKLEVWSYLSKFAAYTLKPGKLLIAYSGKAYLPEIYRRLNEHLDYIWTIALIHTSNKRTYFPKLNIFERWKPILVFAKPTYTPNEPFEDILMGAGREKELHKHAQAEAEAEQLIKKFTKENDLVIDPFCGSGTVLVASKKLNRNFLGFDIDENAIKTTLERLGNAEN